MGALNISRNIIAVECDALQFLHSKLRAVSEPSGTVVMPSDEEDKEKDEET